MTTAQLHPILHLLSSHLHYFWLSACNCPFPWFWEITTFPGSQWDLLHGSASYRVDFEYHTTWTSLTDCKNMKLSYLQCPFSLLDALHSYKEIGRYFSQQELEGFCTQVIGNKSKFPYPEVEWFSLMFMYEFFMHLKQPRAELEGLSKTPTEVGGRYSNSSNKKHVFSSILTVTFLQNPDRGRSGHGKSLT